MSKVYVLNSKKNSNKIKFTSFLLMFSCMVASTSYAKTRTSTHKKATHSSHTAHTKHGSSLHKVSFKTGKHHVTRGKSKVHHSRYAHRSSRGGHVIQCVAFARSASDVQLRGNAGTWWYHAEGVYDRGNTPEPNSVLSFRSTRKMPMGHVAVVTQVVNSRTIIIDQSHWAQRGISHNTPVIDVSPNNDWTAVRVATNGNSNVYGSIYPTHGFIYPSNSGGHVQSASTQSKPHYSSRIKTWSADAASYKGSYNNNPQVAQAPTDDFLDDAPNRSIR